MTLKYFAKITDIREAHLLCNITQTIRGVSQTPASVIHSYHHPILAGRQRKFVCKQPIQLPTTHP